MGVLQCHISFSFPNIIFFFFFTEIHLYLLNILPTLTCASPYFVTVASEANPNGLLPEHHRQVPSAHPVPRSASTSDCPRSPFNKAAPHQTSQPACQRSSSTPPNFWPPSSPSHLCSAPPDPVSLSTPPRPNPLSALPGPELSSIPPPNSPLPSSAAVRKALYRAKKKLLSSTKTTALQKVKTPATKVDQATPESKRVKKSLFAKLHSLKKFRSKKSLACKKLLLDIISQNANDVTSKPSPYKRRQKNLSTLTAISYLEDVAVDLPDKRTVSRRSLQQQKVLPKRLKRLHRDFLKLHVQSKVSLRTFYCNLPQHIKTVGHQT